ncbi:NADP-dependent oxidoreductase domain-containing protein [Aspergillus californicus]
MTSSAEIVFGGAAFQNETAFGGLETMKEALAFLKSEGVKIIDTAAMYADSEEVLGKLGAAKEFTIHSKYPGGVAPTPSTTEGIIAVAEAGLKKLNLDSFDVYYFHSPDRRVPWEIQLAAINTLYESGKLARFGLSNFLAAEVEEIVRISKEKGWILPTVYQGNYSAIARRAENELFPTLRKHGIEFYAYSPIAGGFLTKEVDQILQNASGRWDPSTLIGQLYSMLYKKPTMLEGLKMWEEISKESGIPKVELAYRWVVHNSGLKGELGDKVIIGSRSLEQMKETLTVVKKGPLSGDVVERIEEVWKLVEKDAPLDNYNDGLVQLQAAGSLNAK